jgi:L-iditol 2-dehydrogenase
MRKARVIASDINTYRLGKAVEFGADAVINAAGDSSGQLREVNNNRPADVVIVCAAAQKAAVDAFASVDRRGEILFFAAPRDDIPIPSMNLWRNEIAMMFSYGASPDDIKEAIHLTENGYVNVAGMVTHRVPLAAIMDGFRITAEANESLKVVVVPDGDIQES